MPAKKIPIKCHDADECPITATIDVIGGKWKPPIIWLLMEGPLRFAAPRRIFADRERGSLEPSCIYFRNGAGVKSWQNDRGA